MDERCEMCRDAGFPNVLAHYKAIPKGQSHDGKAHPPLCWDHKHGKTPNFVKSVAEQGSLEALVERTHQEIADAANSKVAVHELCFCGRDKGHRGRHKGVSYIAPGVRKPAASLAESTRTTLERSVTHSEVLTVEAGPTKEIKQRRVQTILVPGAKPTHHVRLTPELAQAVWDSLSLEEKFKIFDVESMWRDYDDDLRMATISKVLLIYPEDIKEAAK